MTVSLGVLQCGSCERLKAGVHATALGLAALMGIYNAAAWLSRRQLHLAINTVLYTALIAWEQKHVSHHLAELRRPPLQIGLTCGEPEDDPAAQTNEAAA